MVGETKGRGSRFEVRGSKVEGRRSRSKVKGSRSNKLLMFDGCGGELVLEISNLVIICKCTSVGMIHMS